MEEAASCLKLGQKIGQFGLDLQMTVKRGKPAPAKVGPERAEQCALSG